MPDSEGPTGRTDGTPALRLFCTESIAVQMGQQNEILHGLWFGCEFLGDGHSWRYLMFNVGMK